MSDKISPVAVVVDAVRLIHLRWQVYLASLVIVSIAGLPMVSLSANPDPEAVFSWAWFSAWGGSLLVGMAVYIVVIHDSLTTLRGNSVLLPDGFGFRFFHFFWKSLLFLIMIIGLGMVFAIPSSMVLVPLFSGSPDSAGISSTSVVIVIATVLPMFFFAYRWGMALFAIPVGDTSSFRLSWRMTKGHSIRMLVSYLPFFLMVVLMQVVIAPAMEAGSYDFFSILGILWMIVGSGLFWVSFATWIIWYEKLRLRYETLSANDPEFEFKED